MEKDRSPKKALNKAFLKIKPNRSQIETFKGNLIKLIGKIDEIEREENQKTHVRDFLRDTYYIDNHEINTKNTIDLVIHHGKDNKSDVGVIIEAKRPSKVSEMITLNDINRKAFHELLLYYFHERITEKNINIKHLIVTNVYEWFIFDETIFERFFHQNKKLVKKFLDFESSNKPTDVFYKEIAEPFIAAIKNEIDFTYIDIRDYEKPLRNKDKNDDNKLIVLFKLLSPEHLLKLPFINDSNSLDKRFYSELLHIIGLTETKEGGKKIIQRNKVDERNSGSLIENAIIEIESLDKISRLENKTSLGETHQERLFNVALELSITWINRILFLKLLEGQLVSYHKRDKNYQFLNYEKINDYDELNSLFFKVLAVKQNERIEDVKNDFMNVPYLNSSLFEPTEMEQSTIVISNLRDERAIPIYSQTVLKDLTGKKRSGEINPLNYLFEFLNAYDFASEGKQEIQEENKTLINASVLGLIFEKINGYKDGSFFTPGFITMYMCRETIRKAVIQKFNDTKGWNCEDIPSLYNKIDNLTEANQIINTLKICDPAVGSGHFLVSALNEIIAIKHDLKILVDREGKRLKEYHFEVINDELMITDEEGDFFEYNPTNKESHRIQETLFHEKQVIIENCLFGVDINPNSVKICRLRLWIELLKNAYYKNETELETLPNIDINIKCGNSLVSRYTLDTKIKKLLQSSKWNIDSYKLAVSSYRNAKSKEEKRELERLILKIKQDFSSEIRFNDPLITKRDKLLHDIYNRFTGNFLFEPDIPFSKKEKDLELKGRKEKEKMESQVNSLTKKINDIKDSKIFQNSFEWRFEFPEVLNDDGDFVGFDVVIGNPPYVNFANLPEISREFFNKFELYKNKTDLYAFFVGLSSKIKSNNGYICLIIPHTWISTTSFFPLRKLLIEQINLTKIVELKFGVFKDAYVKTVIIQTDNKSNNQIQLLDENFLPRVKIPVETILKDEELKINLTWNSDKYNIFSKIKTDAIKLGDIVHFSRGIKTSDDNRFLFNEKSGTDYYKVIRGRNIKAYRIDYDNEYIWYRPDLMKEKKGCLPHSKEIFLTMEKIITQRVNSSGQLLATYDNEQYFCLDTTNISTEKFDNNFNFKFIVGIINSKLINWWFNDEFKNPTISGYELHQIPIKKNLTIENKISMLVESIIENYKIGITDKHSISEIDQLVYELYGLTEEEIRIVEESVK
ncbi:MAG TPA: TaqI-like C-terminal specificity domain-containing protein [Bacteroidales bacterium]|nr:TaqI-like C-terminal specificity domain-containing protein [Bacteroidales bacterium]HPS71120.1 TaqI-like C-terminal specificity domain-containing protein [Bacteroidales bacterium]